MSKKDIYIHSLVVIYYYEKDSDTAYVEMQFKYIAKLSSCRQHYLRYYENEIKSCTFKIRESLFYLPYKSML